VVGERASAGRRFGSAPAVNAYGIFGNGAQLWLDLLQPPSIGTVAELTTKGQSATRELAVSTLACPQRNWRPTIAELSARNMNKLDLNGG
jgi:hypothetical protein